MLFVYILIGRVSVWKKVNSGWSWCLMIRVCFLLLFVVVSSIGLFIRLYWLMKLNRCLNSFVNEV